jgi:hypothetical protein
MKNLNFIAVLIVLGWSSSALAQQCHTPRHEIEFEIQDETLTFFLEAEKSRSVASNDIAVKRFSDGRSMTQVFEYHGHQHVIHMAQVGKPDPYADYYLKTNDKGESMLYPLHCNGQKALVSLR